MVNRKSRLLVLKYPFVLAFKKKETGLYSLIGGNIEPSENASEALIRESKEEANININTNDFTFIGTTKYQKQEVLHERNYYLLKDNNRKFKLKEVEKFDTLEWIDFYDNQRRFKNSDRKIIQKIFIEGL